MDRPAGMDGDAAEALLPEWGATSLQLSNLVIYFSICIALVVVVVTICAVHCVAEGDGVIMRHCPTGNTAELKEAAAREARMMAAAAADAADEEESSGRECWVCLNSGADAGGQRLLRGCACRGTAGWVHLQCLVSAAQHKPTMWSQCPSCKQRYTGTLLLKLSRTRWEQVRSLPVLSHARLNAAQTRATIAQSFGRQIEEIFEEFGTEPVASGSIAQVYKAKLLPQFALPGGVQNVAVKVRHPTVMDESFVDMETLFGA